MIFAHTLDNVLSGIKSQTRRVVKPGDRLEDRRRLIRGKRTLYEVGKTYAVQPSRTGKSVARIRLTGIRQEPVAVISEADAIAEGFATREEFFATWRHVHGQNADLDQPVWVFEFALVTEPSV